MNKRQAMMVAHGIAYRALQKALDVGGDEAGDSGPDQKKVEDALDKLAQHHFERWESRAKP